LALNLGHTFAHAIESASDFAVSHGEAVAMGLVASARLGARLELSPPGLVEQLRGWVQAAGLESEPPRSLSRARVRTAFLADKKRRAGRQRLVVPLGAGQGAQLVYDLEPRLPQDALFGGG
ncbi:MAG: 3-dehydroquinate synthase, partial [Candidatus Dormiibacterota bacterium]